MADRLNAQRKNSTRSRKISYANYNGRQVERRYFYDKTEFKRNLEEFNRIKKNLPDSYISLPELEERKSQFKCVGLVNVTMQMCSTCRDADKSYLRTDKYYIDELEKAQTRTILCEGCLSKLIMKWKGESR